MDQASSRTIEDGEVSQSVIEAVAEERGVPPEELPPLYGHIDPDALDELFATTPSHDRFGGEVTFIYDGYAVTVSGEGYLSIEPCEE